MKTSLAVLLLIVAALLSACGGGSSAPVPPLGGGVLLLGAPSTLAVNALISLPPVGVDQSQIENGVIKTRLDLRIAPDATVSQINAALESVGARIVTMQPNSLGITVSIPEQQSVAGLAGVAQALSAMPGIRLAWLARTPQPAALPFPATPGNITASQHLLPSRFPAAWNARKLLDGCLKVPVLIADHFAPTVVAGFRAEVPGFPPANGTAISTHGYDVAGTLAALFNATPPTGANPFTECLDLRSIQVGDISRSQTSQAIVDAFPEGKFILNLSLGFDDAICFDAATHSVRAPCTKDNVLTDFVRPLERAIQALQWKELTHTRWLDFLVVNAAGNEKNKDGAAIYPGLAEAAFGYPPQLAQFSDTIFSSFVLDRMFWEPTPAFAALGFPSLAASPQQASALVNDVFVLGLERIPRADNVLTVGSTSALPTAPLPAADLQLSLTESRFSNNRPDVTAVGEEVLVVCPTGLCPSTNGTSFSAPQVAGLASYLWLLSPELRSLPAAVTAEAIKANVFPTLKFIDAYATILSLDAAARPNTTNAPIRKAILDVTDDGQFDEADLRAYLLKYLDSSTGQPVLQPTHRAFERFDLNGDGFTGGPNTQRFDLNRVGSTQFGATVYSTTRQIIESKDVEFDENSVTDLNILCYYAYSPLYTGNTSQRGALLSGLCTDITISVDPGAVSLAPRATQQFGAAVRGASNIHVTWTATGGTITPEGLFTAGSMEGTFSVRAVSVADRGVFADATVTITGVSSGVRRNTSRGTVSVMSGTNSDRPNGICTPPFRHSPDGATAQSDTLSCDGGGGDFGFSTYSFTESYTGSDLVAVTATGSSRSINGGIDGGFPFGGGSSQYTLEFSVARTTQVSIDASTTNAFLFAGPLNSPGGIVHRIDVQEGGTPVNQTLTLTPGRYFLSINAIAGGTASFSLSLTFGP